MDKIFRHEYKYIISNIDEKMISNRISSIMKKDNHCEPKGFYTIRSLYFDDFDNSNYYDNEIGVDPREKIRIRNYDGNNNYIVLEKKRKQNGKIHKESCKISVELCKKVLSGDITKILSSDELSDIGKSILLSIQNKGLKPKVIVEYDRIPYVYKAGNVRVTIDKNIVSSSQVGDFFHSTINRRAIMQCNKCVLEVKWDQFIPNYIFQACQINDLLQTTFSKYYLCRKYHI